MSTPLSLLSRIEALECRLDQRDLTIRGLLGRLAMFQNPRECFLARTVAEDDYTGYPQADGANAFGLMFIDRAYTPAEGVQAAVDGARSAAVQAVGRTINGQWVIEGEVVLALTLPPPPGSTDKGRWAIVPSKNYYWGILEEDLAPLSAATVNVWRRESGAWAPSPFRQTVTDRLLFDLPIEKGTWVRFSWETDVWVVDAAACFVSDGYYEYL